MKIKCLKQDLERALLSAQKVINKNQSLPVLENALFEARGDELFVKATNIEVFVEYRITVSLEKDGEFAAPIDVLLQSVKNAKEGESIELELKGNALSVKDKNSSFKIKTVAHDEFPKLKKPEALKESNLKINKDLFINGIKSVYSFSSSMSIKPELSSVFVYYEEDNLVFVATDQFRLAEKKIKYTNKNDFQSVLIPTKNAGVLLKILEFTENTEFKFLSEENQISLESDELFVSSRVLDLSFPDYKAIIPNSFETKIILLKEDLLSAIKKSALFTDKFGKLSLSLNKSKLKLKAENKDIGEIDENIEVKTEGKDEFEANFNYRFLQEGISAIFEDSVEIWFTGNSAPLLIKGVGDSSFVYILMPMNN